LIQNFVIANEVKQSSTVVIRELLDCRVLPRFARSFGTLLAMTQLIRASVGYLVSTEKQCVLETPVPALADPDTAEFGLH